MQQSTFPYGPNVGLIGEPGSRFRLETPALVLDLDILNRNVAIMAEHSRRNGYLLRPCFKVYKSVQIARRQVEAGAVGVCCATLAETECAARAGIPSVMLFSTVVTAGKLERLTRLNSAADGVIVVTDDTANVADLAAAARRSGRDLAVMADYEIGGGRTGVPDASATVQLARRIADSPGLRYAGLQAYNGKVLHIPDYEARRAALAALMAELHELVDQLSVEGLAPGIVSGGGTGSYDIEPEFRVFTEIQAGSYVHMDVNYGQVQLCADDSKPFGIALTVCASVISTRGDGYVITDAGAKEVDGIYGTLPPLIAEGAPAGSRYSMVGDDLGRIDIPSGAARPAVGERVTIVPPHAWQTVPLHPVYHCVSGDRLVDIWPVDAREVW